MWNREVPLYLCVCVFLFVSVSLHFAFFWRCIHVLSTSEMELELKTILSPIREKTRSLDSLDGTVFVNRSAIAAAESESDKPITYTELATIKDSSAEVLNTAASGRHQLPPIQLSGRAVDLLGGGQLPIASMAGRLPPLFPPGHSQEDSDKSDHEQLTTVLWKKIVVWFCVHSYNHPPHPMTILIIGNDVKIV